MWKPEKILFDESDDEGLSYVYFDFGDFRYFTLTLNPDEDDEIYLEFNEQTFSIESNNVTYTLNNRILSFDFGADIQGALKIEKHIDIDIVSHIDINSFGKTLANIFSNAGKP
ncbi:RNA polymerase subunit sigma [Neisseria elongata]|uniref:RNA polymerase subunit sigma n=1 Tax=Neisseria elongata TaxID=495 RepID=UPI000D2FF208|nr:RNA polymerase subunit sigma [Neisseria elongata]